MQNDPTLVMDYSHAVCCFRYGINNGKKIEFVFFFMENMDGFIIILNYYMCVTTEASTENNNFVRFLFSNA